MDVVHKLSPLTRNMSTPWLSVAILGLIIGTSTVAREEINLKLIICFFESLIFR